MQLNVLNDLAEAMKALDGKKKVSMTVERLALCRFTELMQQQDRS
jgi:hypothetical protein